MWCHEDIADDKGGKCFVGEGEFGRDGGSSDDWDAKWCGG